MRRKEFKYLKELCLTLCIAALAVSCGTKLDGRYHVEIYATNDVHAQFFDTDYSGAPKEYSLSKVATYINQRRAELGDSAVALLDLGDMLQGDASAAFFNNYPHSTDTIYDGEHFLVNIMEFLRYDLGVIGNHDVEAGHNAFDRLKDELDSPYLGANVFDQKSGKPYFREYTILEKGGLRIAIVGLTTHWVDHWLDKSFYEGLTFKNPATVADSLIPIIKKRERPDLIGIAMHSGTGDGLELERENLGKYIAANIPDVDFIFTGHDHTPFAEQITGPTGEPVSIINSGAYARNLSKASITLTYKEGKVVEKEILPEVVPMETLLPDAEYDSFVQPYYNLVKDFSERQIGTLAQPVVLNDALTGYSDYVNFLNTIQLKITGADISFAAPLKTNLVLPAGKIDYSTVMNIYPFENILYVVSMTGQQIKDYLEYDYDLWIRSVSSPSDTLLNIVRNPKSGKWRFKNPSFNFDAAKGINYLVDITKPYGSRITITSMGDGLPFMIDKTFRVAMTSYRANGGGDLMSKGAGIKPEELDGLILDRFPGIREMIYTYFTDGGEFIHNAPSNWTFIPAPMAKKMMERDIKLVTNK